MRVHKESFNALVQFRIENVTSGYTDMDPDLKLKVQQLQQTPNAKTVNEVIACPAFEHPVEKILQTSEDSESQMTVRYLKDGSLLFSLISAVRERNICRHLQAERQLLKLYFAFHHINYSRYMSFQHSLCKTIVKRIVKYLNKCKKELMEKAYLVKSSHLYMVI